MLSGYLAGGTEKKYEIVCHNTNSRATAELGSRFPIWCRFAKFKHFFEHRVVQGNDNNKKKRPHWRPRHRRKNDINSVFLEQVLSEEIGLVWANVTQDRR
jgi:hypothetical protein